jgi:hypothetical protein
VFCAVSVSADQLLSVKTPVCVKMSSKRARTQNFTVEESLHLVDAVEKHPIVNCKKTDASSNRTKVSGPYIFSSLYEP